MFWGWVKEGKGGGFCRGRRVYANQEKRIGKGGGECKGLIQCYQALGLQDCDCLCDVALARNEAIVGVDFGYIEVFVESAKVVAVELSKGSCDGVWVHHCGRVFGAAMDLFDQTFA